MDISPQLVEQAKQSPEAFGAIFDQAYRPIYLFLLKRCGDDQLAHDLAAETFFKALRGIQKFSIRRQVPFSAWLYRIALNELYMHARKQHRLVHVPTTELEAIADHAAPVSATLDATQQHDELHAAIHTLGVLDRTIISLRFFEEKSIQEIADITGKKVGTVKARLHRTLKKLRPQLQPNQIDNII